MAKKLIKSPETELAFCVQQIESAESSFVEWAAKAGDILLEQKRVLKFGEWESWVKEHWPRAKSTAESYMLIAAFADRKAIIESGSVRAAQKLVAGPKTQRAGDLKPEDTEKTESEEIVEEANEIMSESAREATATPGGDSWGNVDQLVHDAEGILEDPPEGYEDVEEDELVMPPLAVAARYQVRQFSVVTVSQWIKEHATEADAEGIRSLLDELFPQKQARPAKRGGFQPPTVLEVAEYCGESGLSEKVQPEAFVDHFTSNGWKVGGKSAMKDWKSAVRNWARRSDNDKPDNAHAGPPKLTAAEQTRHSIRCDIFETDREWAVNATDAEIEAAIDKRQG